MTQREPKSADEWFNQGKKLYWEDKNYEDAIICFDHALDLVPRKYTAWYYKALALRMVGRYQEAIISCSRSLEIKNDYHKAWNNLGLVLDELERYDEAISKYNKALTITHSKYHQAWNNRGNAYKSLRNYKDAIESYDRALQLDNQYWRAWKNKGWALFFSSRYQEALKNWDAGLQQLKPKTRGYKARNYQEGCGRLHEAKGLAQYLHGQHQENPFPCWQEAVKSYHEALKFLTFKHFPIPHLEIIQALIKVLKGLGEKDKYCMLESEGSELLGSLLQQTQSNTKKIQLARKFAAFNQYRVDSLAESGNWSAALELAEWRKNLCLHWLRENRWVEPAEVDVFTSIPLVNSQTSVIYWHISPAAITTFILKHNEPVIGFILTADNTSAGADRQLQKFEGWMKTWKQDVKSGFKTYAAEKYNEIIHDETLSKLASILKVPIIESMLEDISQLILIPHRDLHLLPLHILFSDTVSITYLPSIQVGIDLQKSFPSILDMIDKLPILSIEHPKTVKNQDKLQKLDETSLLYAEIESAAITNMYQPCYRLTGSACTLEAFIQALKITSGIFHFTGHAYHNTNNPVDSALLFANTEQLRLQDLFRLDFKHYHLICLSACETGKTSKQGLIDEFVGLAAGFLATGASCVVSTLWRVDEISAALLMIRFYQLLPNFSPPIALKQAQLWLRDATHDTLAQWCLDIAEILANNLLQSENLEDAAADFQEKAGKIGIHYCPYAHPYHWAAFTVTGNFTI
ncbi:hypothetical protein DSM106972_045040 [Dulcicalothrix desertica PCC 7102]|uniref:CHAT domain-containing protein n=1 Tax=Dulcicalothrix desertica PCC 7102 TaxID=232991 RepID=A0A433VDT6_9CYAN|nr:CHAT domain-containing tetratricopeptide repeat protein [Dulcicalothrix desertica]RUT04276.1 hypothetical protein DSM106972_045040 [Dulcicalothrix desertica PCC 7102]TWH38836.1 CHAT domain-containing protein [Dulcicalothrix desertica PCC 7102]